MTKEARMTNDQMTKEIAETARTVGAPSSSFDIRASSFLRHWWVIRHSSFVSSVALVTLIVVAGVVHGLWTNRWGETAELKAAVGRLDAIPRIAPGWQGVERKLTEGQTKGIAGAFYHRYVQQSSGKGVEIFILCDRPGVVAVHTPDVCYAASGFTIGEKQTFQLDTGAGPEQFITAVFKKESGGEPTYLRIFWAWNNTGPWVAPDEPRLAFATSKMLYKMYVIQELTAPDEPYENGPSVELLRQLLPGMRRALFPQSL
jgi:hypothetical protein